MSPYDDPNQFASVFGAGLAGLGQSQLSAHAEMMRLRTEQYAYLKHQHDEAEYAAAKQKKKEIADEQKQPNRKLLLLEGI